MEYESFDYSVTDGIATVCLDNPTQLNALTFKTYEELETLTRLLEDDGSVHVLIITGTGKAFSSGGSVDEIIGELLGMNGVQLHAFTRLTCNVVRNMRRLRKPIIAAVNGIAAGGGSVLALASDFRILSENAKFAFLFVRVGLAGSDMGAIYLLPRLVGHARAMELLTLGDTVSAPAAERMGLANRVVKPDALMDEALGLAHRLKDGPRYAIGVTKELLNLEGTMELDAALEVESMAQARCMQTPDFHEGFRAFMAKEKPRFNQKEPAKS